MRTLLVLSIYTYSRVVQGCGTAGKSSGRSAAQPGIEDANNDTNVSPIVDTPQVPDYSTGFDSFISDLGCYKTYDDYRAKHPMPEAPLTGDLTTYSQTYLYHLAHGVIPILSSAKVVGNVNVLQNCTFGTWYYHDGIEDSSKPLDDAGEEQKKKWVKEVADNKKKREDLLDDFTTVLEDQWDQLKNPKRQRPLRGLVKPSLEGNLYYCARERSYKNFTLASFGGDSSTWTFDEYFSTAQDRDYDDYRCGKGDETDGDAKYSNIKCNLDRLAALEVADKKIFEAEKDRLLQTFNAEMKRIEDFGAPPIFVSGESNSPNNENLEAAALRFRRIRMACLTAAMLTKASPCECRKEDLYRLDQLGLNGIHARYGCTRDSEHYLHLDPNNVSCSADKHYLQIAAADASFSGNSVSKFNISVDPALNVEVHDSTDLNIILPLLEKNSKVNTEELGTQQLNLVALRDRLKEAEDKLEVLEKRS